MAAYQHGIAVRFITASELAQQLSTGAKLLIVNELGSLPFDRVGATLVFQLVCRRYERGALLLTTNQPFSRWGEVFGDAVPA